MATIRKRGGRYQVQIRRKGHRPVTKSFSTLSDARRWGGVIESQIELGDFARKEPLDCDLQTLLERYLQEVTPHKKSAAGETRRIRRLLKDPVASLRLTELTSAQLAAFRDRRLNDGQRTCQYDLILLRHVLKIARDEWDIEGPHKPFEKVRLPKGPKPRERRLTPEEEESLFKVAGRCRNPLMLPLIEVALETAMRRGELLKARWDNWDQTNHLLKITDTKNGDDRLIPLSNRAQIILDSLPASSSRIFPMTEAAVRMNWDRLVRRAQIEDLRFHDLRHEAISRLFERGLSVPEVALISGHKDYRMLFRYTHLRPEEVAKKLNQFTD
ncbi:site-specific integrase [Pelagibius sp. CAU 1746]|uniref:tyrosine-type recombinase/integrase n=1 Tax=Pelagibius sp. CAU 1746 TaxID=3140370 RepID=UPI00325B129E